MSHLKIRNAVKHMPKGLLWAITAQYGSTSSFCCSTDKELEIVGRNLGSVLELGDVLLLTGDLGAGKSTVSRGIIRAKFNDQSMVVTSPSYLLDNCYQYASDSSIHHIDLYRLPPLCDLSILGMPGIFDTAICLIEWPQRMSAEFRPKSFVSVQIDILPGGDQRRVRVELVGPRWDDPRHRDRLTPLLTAH